MLLADRVALLQDGTITHVGDHRELLETVPAYRELLAADAEIEAVRMSTDDRPEASPATEAQEWRGVAADDITDELTAETTVRLADRSRRLLRRPAARRTAARSSSWS